MHPKASFSVRWLKKRTSQKQPKTSVVEESNKFILISKSKWLRSFQPSTPQPATMGSCKMSPLCSTLFLQTARTKTHPSLVLLETAKLIPIPLLNGTEKLRQRSKITSPHNPVKAWAAKAAFWTRLANMRSPVKEIHLRSKDLTLPKIFVLLMTRVVALRVASLAPLRTTRSKCKT